MPSVSESVGIKSTDNETEPVLIVWNLIPQSELTPLVVGFLFLYIGEYLNYFFTAKVYL